jgi:xylose isomerase
MQIKHAVMIGMLGRVADRFHEYHPAKDLRRRLELARQVEGMDGIEPVYPGDFNRSSGWPSEPEIQETIRILKDCGAPISALNLNVKTQKRWERGSFTAPDPATRAAAVQELKTALDLAAELGTGMVSCCPLIDGHDYAFQADYLQQWAWLEEGIDRGARHRSDVRLSLEYKLNESRNFNVLSDVGRTLYLCERLGLAHVGVTVDAGHALIARETPAEALCLAAQAGRLFYVHFNDNGRDWDWDMLPGSVNFWDLLETVFYLDRLGWAGWLSYDVILRGGDLVEGMSTAIDIVRTAQTLVEKIGRERIQGWIDTGDPAPAFRELVRSLFKG